MSSCCTHTTSASNDKLSPEESVGNSLKERVELLWIKILELMVLLHLGFINGVSQCPLVTPLVQRRSHKASRHLRFIAQSIPSRTQVPIPRFLCCLFKLIFCVCVFFLLPQRMVQLFYCKCLNFNLCRG